MKRIIIGKVMALLLLCFMQLNVFAQGRGITGTVIDSDGEPLPGVSIIVKGTTQGTTTSIEGTYSLEVPDDAVLVFSFIGFTPKEITVGDQSTIDVTLLEDIMELDEIVVVGYGTTKKSDLTGAMASLKEEDFNSRVGATPEQLIQGRVAGVHITSNNGEPGAGTQIRIRGTSTIRTNQQPLYVIDGVPLDFKTTSPDGVEGTALGGAPATNPLNFINPGDIESIDILKDASAAAIYGARGANGVVIITTKKGKEGKAEVEYSTFVSMSQLPKKLDILNAEEFVQVRVEHGRNIEEDDPNHYGYDTDWQDVLFRNALSHSHNLSISGGNEKSTYRTSLGYLNQQGIIEKSDLRRYTGRLNLTQKAIKDLVLLETNITASQVVENRPPLGTTGYEGDILLSALKANPTWPTTLPGGDPFQTGSSSERNPAAMLAYTDDLTRTSRMIGNIAATANIVKDLTYKLNLSLDYANANRQINQSQKLDYMASTVGLGQINNKELYNYLIEHTLNYTKEFDIHKFTFLAGYSYQEFIDRGSKLALGGFASDGILYTNNLGFGRAIVYENIDSWAEKYQLQSFFGRLNYNLLERYLFTATIRADGSSKFGVNNKYGYFPSFALAWRISEESFMKDIDVISNLKLRAGWGQTGNSEIGSKWSQYLYSSDPDSRVIVGGEVISGFSISRTFNKDIKWETTTSTNLGLDFGLFNGKLSGTVDVFRKTTTDLLLETTAPAGSPTATWVRNIDSAKIINEGIEISLNAFPVTKKDFTWEISGSMTFQDNVVKDLPSVYHTGLARGQGLTGQYVQIITDDEPMNVFIGFRIDSVDEDGNVYYLQTEDGQDSLTYLGDPQPNFIWGLNNTFRYKNFDLSFFIEGVHGNTVFNNTALLLDKGNVTRQSSNALSDFVYDDISFNYGPKVNDRYMEDGSYIRLSNVTLGYTYTVKNLDWLSRVRIYISGNNLLLLTDYSGYDPDVSSSSDMGGVKSYGLDITNYPKSRSFLVGLNVTF
ncbi:MAG: TonB-dependent receptor [Bacteroidales bacterium]|nr:TonB-dependent receptor [Bacteroidales bacterium]